MTPQTASWGDTLMASLSSAFSLLFAAVPRIIGFLVILAIGWIIAGLIEKGLVALLHLVRFDHVVQRAGLSGVVQQTRRKDASSLLGALAKWFVRLIVLMVAFDALGVPTVSNVLREFVMWLPNLAVGVVVLVVGGLLANMVGDIVRAAAVKSEVERPQALVTAAKAAVWGFAIVIAADQIGVGTVVVNTLLIGLVGALALALGLSFGLGGRDTAGGIVRQMYEQRRQVAGVVGNASSAANEPPGARAAYTGYEQRHNVSDRRSNPNSRRATL
jgi:hypothetical protein